MLIWQALYIFNGSTDIKKTAESVFFYSEKGIFHFWFLGKCSGINILGVFC